MLSIWSSTFSVTTDILGLSYPELHLRSMAHTVKWTQEPGNIPSPWRKGIGPGK